MQRDSTHSRLLLRATLVASTSAHPTQRTSGSWYGNGGLLHVKEPLAMTATDKIREDRVRRRLAKDGYRLTETPSRSWLRKHYRPGYMIVDNATNTVISGCIYREYSDKLEDVEAFAFKN